MKVRYLFLFCTLLIPSISQGQDDSATNNIGLQYGLHFFSRQDQIFSPMVYHAITPVNLNLNYSNEKGKRIHLAEAEFNLYDAGWHDQYDYQTGFDSIKTLTTLPSGFTVVTVRYAYLREANKSEKSSLWIGGITDNQINSIDNEYGPAATFGYFAHFSLAPAAMYRYQISARHEVTATAWLPLVSWISRSHYAIQDEEYMLDNFDHNGFKTFFRYVGDGNLHLMNHYRQFNLNLGYEYKASRHWSFGGEYRFEFLHDSKPKTITSYQNFINIKTAFRF